MAIFIGGEEEDFIIFFFHCIIGFLREASDHQYK